MTEYINTSNISHYKIFKILYDVLSTNSMNVEVRTDDNNSEDMPVVTITSDYSQDRTHSDFSGAYSGMISISCYHTTYNDCSLLVEVIDALLKANMVAFRNQGLSFRNKTVSDILPFDRNETRNYVCTFDLSFAVNTNA